MRSADLLLHPVRLRVVQAFLGDRDLTTAQLREELPDVAVATLYRHVALLVDGGVLRVVDERRVRGTTERTYALVVEAAQVREEDLRSMGPEEHRTAFLTFVAGLVADFDRYLERRSQGGSVDPVADRTGYRQAVLHLSDEETDELVQELAAVFARYSTRPAGPGRVRRAVSTVLVRD